MTSRASQRMDGIQFEEFRARHTGTVELTEEDAGNLAIGEVVVTVNVETVGDVQAKLGKEGVLARVAVLKVSETVILDGELKALLVEKLGLYGGDTMPPPIRIVPGERTKKPDDTVVLVDSPPADEATGEIAEDEYATWQARQEDPQEENDDDDDEPFVPQGERIGRLPSFDDDGPETQSPGTETLGYVGSKNPVLQKSLNSERGWS